MEGNEGQNECKVITINILQDLFCQMLRRETNTYVFALTLDNFASRGERGYVREIWTFNLSLI